MRKLINSLFLVLIFINTLSAQVKIGDNPDDINSNSALEIESTEKGLLVPRIALTALNNVAPMDAHVEGMVVYNTASSGVFPNQVIPGYYINDGNQWLRFETTSAISNNYGDVKQGFQPSDHSGWYLLDGRALSTLPANAQLAATSLGISSNLPDSRNKFLQHGSSPGLTGGAVSNLVKIEQANLPDIDFIGTAQNGGDHSHSIDPPNTSTTSTGNHTHAIDPPNTSTNSTGNHRHNGLAAFNDQNNSSSQGFPFNNSHQSYRTSDRPGQISVNNGANPLSGLHSHSVNIASFNSSTAGFHSHTVNIASFNSSTSGDHTHTVEVNSGGSGSDLDITPEYLSVNNFIYLGQ